MDSLKDQTRKEIFLSINPKLSAMVSVNYSQSKKFPSPLANPKGKSSRQAWRNLMVLQFQKLHLHVVDAAEEISKDGAIVARTRRKLKTAKLWKTRICKNRQTNLPLRLALKTLLKRRMCKYNAPFFHPKKYILSLSRTLSSCLYNEQDFKSLFFLLREAILKINF